MCTSGYMFRMSAQALCFLAGANSIFDGDKLLTTPNNERSDDLRMFDVLGLTSRPAFHHGGCEIISHTLRRLPLY